MAVSLSLTGVLSVGEGGRVTRAYRRGLAWSVSLTGVLSVGGALERIGEVPTPKP